MDEIEEITVGRMEFAEDGPPTFTPGLSMELNGAKTFIPGKMVKNADGTETFVPGKVVQTKNGPKFVSGQVIQTGEGEKFLPGVVVDDLEKEGGKVNTKHHRINMYQLYKITCVVKSCMVLSF